MYVDTSALVALVFGEERWRDVADAVIAQPSRWLSDFCWGEFTDQIARKVRRGDVSTESGRATLAGVRHFLAAWSWCQIDADDVAAATAMIADDFARSLKLPDAIHLAMAQRTGAILLTADHGQARAAAALAVPHVLV